MGSRKPFGNITKLKPLNSTTDSPNSSNPYKVQTTTITTEKMTKHDNVKVMQIDNDCYEALKSVAEEYFNTCSYSVIIQEMVKVFRENVTHEFGNYYDNDSIPNPD